MAILVEWGNHQREFILVTFSAEWTWDEFRMLENDAIVGMINSLDRPCPLLLDMRRSMWRTSPTLHNEIVLSGKFHQSQQIPLVVFTVVDESIGMLLLNMYQRYGAANCKYKRASHIDEAVDIIAECYA